MSSRRQFLSTLGGGAAAMLANALTGGADATSRRPNIVFILADDLGWRDTSLYGSKYYESPNVDRLATLGMRFSQAYAAAPICSPTRASIMTGLYPARIGMTLPIAHVPQVVLEETLVAKAAPDLKALQCNSITRLKLEYFTIAEALKGAGYTTAHFGKWHLGREPYDPFHQGFDIDIPHTYEGAPMGGYFAPWKFWPGQGTPGEHIEDRMAQEARKFIFANARKDRPFYMNYWCFSVHAPYNAKKDLIEKYRQKAAADPSNPQHNPVYAGMVQSMDDAVGTVTKAIEEAGIADNTIIIFTSDNGGVSWKHPEVFMHPEYRDSPATSNLPLRDGKATLYEGGSREPCIVIWPGRVKPGTQSEQIISSIDWYPTILQMTGVQKKPDLKLDGTSIVPALDGNALNREAIFSFFPHYIEITGAKPGAWTRKGDWKLIRFFADNEDQTDRFELYNLREDMGETNDLAAKNPAKVRELNALIGRFLSDTHAVLPKPNPAYRRNSARPFRVPNPDDLA
jgi:arylsulfatase A-like enzyme